METGSSAMSSDGLVISALAMDARCSCPRHLTGVFVLDLRGGEPHQLKERSVRGTVPGRAAEAALGVVEVVLHLLRG